MAAMLWLTEPARCGSVGAAYINATVKARHEERPVDVAGLADVFDGLPG